MCQCHILCVQISTHVDSTEVQRTTKTEITKYLHCIRGISIRDQSSTVYFIKYLEHRLVAMHKLNVEPQLWPNHFDAVCQVLMRV